MHPKLLPDCISALLVGGRILKHCCTILFLSHPSPFPIPSYSATTSRLSHPDSLLRLWWYVSAIHRWVQTARPNVTLVTQSGCKNPFIGRVSGDLGQFVRPQLINGCVPQNEFYGLLQEVGPELVYKATGPTSGPRLSGKCGRWLLSALICRSWEKAF